MSLIGCGLDAFVAFTVSPSFTLFNAAKYMDDTVVFVLSLSQFEAFFQILSRVLSTRGTAEPLFSLSLSCLVAAY